MTCRRPLPTSSTSASGRRSRTTSCRRCRPRGSGRRSVREAMPAHLSARYSGLQTWLWSCSAVPRPRSWLTSACRCGERLAEESQQKQSGVSSNKATSHIGLVISVSFSKGATQDAVQHAARFLLTARLSMRSERARASAGGASSAESVVSLCKAGEEQGILLMPQASLCSELGKDNIGLQYSHGCPETQASALYKAFIAAFRSSAAELIGTAAPAKELRVVACNFSGRQSMEMTSDGPFMHAFNF
mmetsp:Transcript_150799/g.482658  ORF Transcript_150799/g.482658 Transcript_150799/m.482658 type:complete len:246 (+) Transcript_150799:459-1196(+)